VNPDGFADLLSRLDPRPDVRGRQFERVRAWYLRSEPEYRNKLRRVWLWSEWPDAWAADAGIDLIAEEQDGGLCGASTDNIATTQETGRRRANGPPPEPRRYPLTQLDDKAAPCSWR
jgi:Restriction endonuclease